jgi:hypothetical protein
MFNKAKCSFSGGVYGHELADPGYEANGVFDCFSSGLVGSALGFDHAPQPAYAGPFIESQHRLHDIGKMPGDTRRAVRTTVVASAMLNLAQPSRKGFL